VPAYKIVRTFADHRHIETETVVLEKVSDFDTLFPLYEEEWSYLNGIGYERIWNRGILESDNYHEFTDWHIRELSRLRFLPGEWPVALRELLKNSTGKHLLVASQLPSEVWQERSWTEIRQGIDRGIANGLDGNSELESVQTAIRRAEKLLVDVELEMSDFEQWDGSILSTDFYRIRNAGELALRHIPSDRIEQYRILADTFSHQVDVGQTASTDNLLSQIEAVFTVLSLFTNRLPGDHGLIDLDTGEVFPVEE